MLQLPGFDGMVLSPLFQDPLPRSVKLPAYKHSHQQRDHSYSSHNSDITALHLHHIGAHQLELNVRFEGVVEKGERSNP